MLSYTTHTPFLHQFTQELYRDMKSYAIMENLNILKTRVMESYRGLNKMANKYPNNEKFG